MYAAIRKLPAHAFPPQHEKQVFRKCSVFAQEHAVILVAAILVIGGYNKGETLNGVARKIDPHFYRTLGRRAGWILPLP
jgi:hypothetical protein